MPCPYNWRIGYDDDAVHVVGHDNKRVQQNVWEMFGNCHPTFFCNFPLPRSTAFPRPLPRRTKMLVPARKPSQNTRPPGNNRTLSNGLIGGRLLSSDLIQRRINLLPFARHIKPRHHFLRHLHLPGHEQVEHGREKKLQSD